jgi:hypothetical protein
MHIRKGVKLLEERAGPGALVQRQHEYILAIRLSLKRGEVLMPTPVNFRPDPNPRQRDDGFFEHRTRINRSEIIAGLFYAVQGMRIGGYRKVAISPHLAYGDKGLPDGIPPHAVLIAEIEVLREAATPGKPRARPDLTEAETLTQSQLCARYQITPLTLWRQRKAGLIPAPAVIDRPVRWGLATIERWEADGRPHCSPSFDEVYERRERAFTRIMVVAEELHDPVNQGPADAPSDREKEHTRLVREIEAYDDQIYELTLELALLVDEAGLWHGPPLDRLVSDSAARGPWRSMVDVLEKILAG